MKITDKYLTKNIYKNANYEDWRFQNNYQLRYFFNIYFATIFKIKHTEFAIRTVNLNI